MESWELVVYALATWRLASLLVNEAGPWHVFQRLRELAGITHDEDGNKVILPHTFFGELLACVWCASVWVGAFWVGFDLLVPAVAVRVALVFALSAGGILVQRLAISD